MIIKYFDNEIFDNVDVKQLNVSISDDEINIKYMKGEVRIVTEQGRYPLPTLSALFNTDNYEMQPEFQRRRRWNVIKKSKLIESFIINVPVPPVFLYEIDYDKYEVMDGLQRISTVVDFYEDKFELEGLEVWSELNGRRYSKLPEKVKDGINRRYLSSIILMNESAKSKEQADTLKKIVFERLNSGGVKLSPQETRNALYDGEFNRLCIKLSTDENFKKLWGLSQMQENDNIDQQEDDEVSEIELYKNMGDVELVLRFFSFRFLDYYTIKLEKFMDNFIKKGNSFTLEVVENYEKLFYDTIELADALFGEYAFRQYKKIRSKWDWRDPSRLIYDPIMQVLSCYTDKCKLIKVEDKSSRIDKLKSFYENNDTIFNGKKQSKNDIKYRMDKFEELILSIFE